MSGIVANSEALKVRHSFEFLDPLYRRNLVRDVFNHDFNASEGVNLRNRSIGVVERHGAEYVFRISKVHHHVRQSNMICQFESAFNLIHGRFAEASLGIKD